MNSDLANASDFIGWLKTKADLNSKSTSAAKRLVKRGQVYWCNFGVNIGSEMSKLTPRPAIIVQNYIANKNSTNTIVVPITHDIGKLPCLVPITPASDSTGKVILDGQANTSNIICISKARLGDYITTLSNVDMKKLDESIAKSVELMHYYKELSDKNEKLSNFIITLKQQRNEAQDKLKSAEETMEELKKIVESEMSDKDILLTIKKLLTSI